jgi:hypothetical protein
VEARKLIEGANYGPVQLAVLRQAFDAAWEQLAPSVSARASAIQAARLRLANAVLAAAPNGPMQVERIKADALKAVLAGPKQ